MRSLMLFSVVALFATSGFAATPETKDPVAIASAQFMKEKVATVPVAGNLTMVSGVGGNVLAILGTEGTTLVDTGVTPRVEALDAALAELKAKPVITLVNTHYHFDHVGGNLHYGSKGARIIAQENVKKRLSAPQNVDFFQLTFPAAPAAALPSITFTDHYTLKAGGHTLELVHPPEAAHTDGDVFIRIPGVDLIVAGDIFFNGLYPFIDYSARGNIDGMIEATDAVLAAAGPNTKIIGGHGPIAGVKELKAYRAMLATVAERIHALIDQGKSEDEAVAAKPTADLDAAWGNGLFTGEQFTRLVYRGLKTQ